MLIDWLGNVTTRDHKALAHALFRQFDPGVPLYDLEDRVVILLARLADEVELAGERYAVRTCGVRRGAASTSDGGAALRPVNRAFDIPPFRRVRLLSRRHAASADTAYSAVPPTQRRCRASSDAPRLFAVARRGPCRVCGEAFEEEI